MKRVEAFFAEKAIQSEIERLFWVKIPEELLDDLQASHKECQPHVFAVELGMDSVRFELFTRTLKSFQCKCQGYLTGPQRSYVFDYGERMINRLEIRT